MGSEMCIRDRAGSTPTRLSRYPHAGGSGLAEPIPAVLVEPQRMSCPDPRGSGPFGEKRTKDPPDGLLITIQTQIHIDETTDGPLGQETRRSVGSAI